MLTIDALKAFGANTDEGLQRCLNNESFYLMLVGKAAADDSSLTKLADALAAKDLDTAFESAHALKGVMANLALAPILTPISEMTELLRSRTDTDYSGLLKEAQTQFSTLRALAND